MNEYDLIHALDMVIFKSRLARVFKYIPMMLYLLTYPAALVLY